MGVGLKICVYLRSKSLGHFTQTMTELEYRVNVIKKREQRQKMCLTCKISVAGTELILNDSVQAKASLRKELLAAGCDSYSRQSNKKIQEENIFSLPKRTDARQWFQVGIYVKAMRYYLYITVDKDSMQAPLKMSLFVSLQSFSKIKKVNFITH